MQQGTRTVVAPSAVEDLLNIGVLALLPSHSEYAYVA